MIKINFHAGTHGQFLEYITNVFILGVDDGGSTLWNAGTNNAHNKNEIYKKNKIIHAGHCSANSSGHHGVEVPHPLDRIDPDDRLINIILDPADDMSFTIARINVLYRGGYGFENNMTRTIPEEVREDRKQLRNQWFSVFNEMPFRESAFPTFDPHTNDDINFPYTAFFNYCEFCAQLKRIADWLGHPFKPVPEIYQRWAELIERNQGWNSYTKCHTIINDILSNKDTPIECTAIEEGFINYNILRITGKHHGAIFDSVVYPTNAQDIYKEL